MPSNETKRSKIQNMESNKTVTFKGMWGEEVVQ